MVGGNICRRASSSRVVVREEESQRQQATLTVTPNNGSYHLRASHASEEIKRQLKRAWDANINAIIEWHHCAEHREGHLAIYWAGEKCPCREVI